MAVIRGRCPRLVLERPRQLPRRLRRLVDEVVPTVSNAAPFHKTLNGLIELDWPPVLGGDSLIRVSAPGDVTMPRLP